MELIDKEVAKFRVTIREVETGLSKTFSIKDGSLIEIFDKLKEVFKRKP